MPWKYQADLTDMRTLDGFELNSKRFLRKTPGAFTPYLLRKRMVPLPHTQVIDYKDDTKVLPNRATRLHEVGFKVL
jgi:hypothetical protein